MALPKKPKGPPAEGELPFEYEWEPAEEVLTAYAGVPFFVLAMRSFDVPASVQRQLHVKQRQRGFDEATYVESFLVLNALDGDCLEDFARLREDAGLGEMLGHELPSPEAARKFLYAFHDEGRIRAVKPGEATTALLLADGTTVVVARYLTTLARPGDEVEFNGSFSGESRTELRIVRAGCLQPKELYQAQIGYVTQPRADSRQAQFLRAEVVASGLGIRWIHLPASAVRDHFYRGDRSRPWAESPTL